MKRDRKETLTEEELRVLSVLKQQARDSVDTIAKKSGFSRQKVTRIINRLEKEKTIWGYCAITGTEATDPYGNHFTLLLKRTTTPLDDVMKKEVVYEKLDDSLPTGVKIENIIMVHGGSWNALVTFYAPDLRSAREVMKSMQQRFGNYLGEYLLLQHLFPIRKNGFKNPKIKNLVDYI